VNSERARFALRIGFSAAAAVLVLVGASMNVTGRTGLAAFLAGLAGLLAIGAGLLNWNWKGSVPLGVAAALVALFSDEFNLRESSLLLQLTGLLLLALGGFVGSIAYRSMSSAIRSHVTDLDHLRAQLEHRHRAFLAATSDAENTRPLSDIAGLTAHIAHLANADLACYYASTPDEKQFVPQPPGIGLERLHPQPVARGAKGAGRLLSAIQSSSEYVASDQSGLAELFSYVPEEVHVASLMAVPMHFGEQVGGFILLGKKVGDFDDDDRRLAITLIRRAGAHLASAHAVALSRRESARYSLFNELVKETSGKTMEETLKLVLAKGQQVIRYDSGSCLLYTSDAADE